MIKNTKKILHLFKSGRVSEKEALKALGDLSCADIGFAKIDHHRSLRRGFPEVVFGQGKTVSQIVEISRHIIRKDGILLVTRAPKEAYKRLKSFNARVRYSERARAIFFRKNPPVVKNGLVLVVTAGTADLPVAEEAMVVLKLMGNNARLLCDVGVAGIHRVLTRKKLLDEANVIIVVAGMEGALASVVSGLVASPVIAVPTSVGYGASFGGMAALLTMMNSCSPGVSVVNIDNGFGAGYFASLINK